MSGSLPNPELASADFVGSTSGTITVQAPAVAGVNVLTLPAASGDLAVALTGTTASIGGSALSPGAVSTGTVAVAGAAIGMAVIATPETYPGVDAYWDAYISSAGTVTVNVGVVTAGTPVASVYAVRIIE